MSVYVPRPTSLYSFTCSHPRLEPNCGTCTALAGRLLSKPTAERWWLLRGDSPCGCYITNHLKDNVSLTCLWIMCCSLVMQLLSNAVCVCACLGIPCETPIICLCCIFHICYLHSSFIFVLFQEVHRQLRRPMRHVRLN